MSTHPPDVAPSPRSASSPLPGPPTGIVVENDHIAIVLAEADGTITSIRNKDADLEAISHRDDGPPWRIQLATIDDGLFDRRPTLRGRGFGKTEIVLYFLSEIVGGAWSSTFLSFDWSADATFTPGTAVDLRWTRADGIEVIGRVELPDGARDASFTVTVDNPTIQTVLAVEYPIVNGIGVLGDGSSDNHLAHSVDGGFLFQDPFHLFRDPEIVENWLGQGMIDTSDPRGHPDEGRPMGGLYRTRAYPNGFEGSPMQFFTYYKDRVGGFYFASHDPDNTDKMLNFYAAGDREGLTASFVHYAWDWAPGRDLEIDYPTSIGALSRGTWHEAAARYRRWATGTGPGRPDWCSRGTLRDRVGKGSASRWLVEEVGFNTFGLPISIDVSAWYDAFHRITDAPVLHVVGHDWEGGATVIAPEHWDKLADLVAKDEAPSLYEMAEVLGVSPDASNAAYLRDRLTRMRKDLWGSFNMTPFEPVPPVFDPANIETIRENGDYLVPFYLSDFIGWGHDTEEYGCLVPYTPFTTAFMCPTTPYWQDYHAQRDARLVDAGAEGIYYDVSACCAAPTLCLNRRHDHPVGFGRGLIRAYEEVFRQSREAASAAADAYVPIGTEVVVENLIGVVDFAQCRAGAGVQATMEGEEFIVWQKDRRAVKIPMFSFVYHEFGPVLIDGWAQVSPEFGDIFYEIGARVALEGGLLQLNYEFAPPELFEGMEGSSYQLAYTNRVLEEQTPRPVDAGKLAFVRDLAEARTGYAKDYLAYGAMTEPLSIISTTPQATLDWSHFNSVFKRRIERGEYTTDSVVQVGWRSDTGRLGFLFVNLLHETLSVTVAPDPAVHDLGDGPFGASTTTAAGTSYLGEFLDEEPLSLELPPRQVVLVELTPSL